MQNFKGDAINTSAGVTSLGINSHNQSWGLSQSRHWPKVRTPSVILSLLMQRAITQTKITFY